jgi:hypothetical protein
MCNLCNLAFLGRNGGKRRYLLGHPLAAAGNAALKELTAAI